MLQSEVFVISKKESKVRYYLSCGHCQNTSKKDFDPGVVLTRSRQSGWVTRFATGSGENGKYAPGTWCCPSCVAKGLHLTTEEKLKKKLTGLTQDELDRICQPKEKSESETRIKD